MKKNKITTKTFVMTAVIGSALIVSALVASTILSSRKSVIATEEAVSAVSSFYLEAMADRRAKTITNLIDSNFTQMEKALTFIQDEKIESQEDLRVVIGRLKSLLSLDRFALVDEDNIVYTQYTTYTGGSRHPFLAEEKMDERIISTVSIYGSSRQMCLAIPTPGLSIMGKPFKACFVQIDIREIVDLLAFDDQGRTHFGVYTKNGENLSDTELGPVILKQNIFEAIRGIVPEEVRQKNHNDFANGVEGSLTFTYNGASETLCYVPIPGTDWEMTVLIRESVIHDQIRDISEKMLAYSRNQIVLTFLSVLVLAVILFLQFQVLARNKLEAEKENSRMFKDMANTDSMTGVRNKHAYSEMEAFLNQRIRDDELKRLAVVVCDINGLKHVNDTQGHAAGDKLIKDASTMICEYFIRGAVFRTGGDEFVILLQDKGCDTMMEVIDEFNRTVEANIEKKEVVVSIGYSTLGQGDRQVRDVFERADRMMYERKKQLKEMGANTRDA